MRLYANYQLFVRNNFELAVEILEEIANLIIFEKKRKFSIENLSQLSEISTSPDPIAFILLKKGKYEFINLNCSFACTLSYTKKKLMTLSPHRLFVNELAKATLRSFTSKGDKKRRPEEEEEEDFEEDIMKDYNQEVEVKNDMLVGEQLVAF